MGRFEILPLLAAELPEVSFSVAPLGSFADDWRVFHVLPARYLNLYADTSGVRFFVYLVEAVQTAGAHKILFGSGGPLLHPELELHKTKFGFSD